MTVVFKMKLRRVGGSLVISIPREIYEGMEWKQGDVLILEAKDDGVKLRKS